MLRCVDITKRFTAGDVVTTALDRVNLEIANGEYVAVMGPSGCGKSTLLSVLGMLETPDSGEVWFQDTNIAGWSEARLSELRRNRIAFVFQEFNLIEDLSVTENVELALEYSSLRARVRRGRVGKILDELGLGNRADHRPSQLSGGQQQRVAIARALVAQPALLLADEPTGNLDTAHGEDVMRLLREINDRGTAVVMVTHSVEYAAHASRAINLLDGAVVDGERQEDLRADAN